MMDTLEYGRRPYISGQCGKKAMDDAMRACPGFSMTRPPKSKEQIGDEVFYDVWGPVLGVWEGFASDEQIRFEGASGGVATALALIGIEQLNMSGALHIRARRDVPYLNQTVLSHCREELLAGAASRYAPASPCDGLDLVERSDRPCVFIGKPCDAAAIKKMEHVNPKLVGKIGFSIAFFCAGTPSLQGNLEMLRQMGVEDPSSVVSLRYRGRGWPGMATVEYRLPDGTLQERQLTYDQSWGDILQKYRQWRCYICPDHIGEFADIAVADAWHRSVEEHQPGRSVMIARTERGREIIERAIRDGYLKAESVSHKILPLCRPGQAEYQAQLWARLKTLKTMGVPSPDYRNFNFYRLWRSELSVKEKVRSVLSTVKRIFVKKLLTPRKMESYAVGVKHTIENLGGGA
jgi:coenzyme F420 hydrogenase subunit beta